jgi:ABC-type bacteriocin/lantibiotic exporter with double-glycine peptidase domain
VPLGNFDPISLRAHIGDCLSQKILFQGTVMENLTMGRPDISYEDVRWALENLELTEFVQTLPEGLETELVPESPLMPQSVVRRLILAKCIAKRPQLLVMDDFLPVMEKEHLDHIIDFLTCDEMNTVIAASNDPVFAAKCDKIVVMQEGTVIDTGTFEEIKEKAYFELLYQIAKID